MCKRNVRSVATLAFLVVGGLASNSPAFAHRNWCHGLHACPSDQGTYVCGDQGRCDLCPDNEYCKGRISRQGAEPLAVPLLRQEISRKVGERRSDNGGSASGGGGIGTGSTSAKKREPCPPGTQRTEASASAIVNKTCSEPKPTKNAPATTPERSQTGGVAPGTPGNDSNK